MAKKLYSIFTADLEHCYECGKPHAQIHHMMNSANKAKAEKYGLILPLCINHHTGADGVHTNPEKMLKMKQMAQDGFEAVYYGEHYGEPDAEEDARRLWIKEFGKSYL